MKKNCFAAKIRLKLEEKLRKLVRAYRSLETHSRLTLKRQKSNSERYVSCGVHCACYVVGITSSKGFLVRFFQFSVSVTCDGLSRGVTLSALAK